MVNTAAVLVLAMAAVAVAQEREGQREARQTVTAASNAFTCDLYKVLRSTPGNLIASPLSAGAVLALLLQGAGGRTAQELRTALHLPDDAAAVRLGYQALFAALQSKGDMELCIANKVYPQKGYYVKETFERAAVDFFRSDVQELDYQKDANGARKIINSWVEKFTNGKIKDIIDDLRQDTLMVLVNAVYFKGFWMKPFPEKSTKLEPFHTTPTTQVQVPMMHVTWYFKHTRLPDIGAHVLELPYRGESMKMLVILPDAVDGLAHVEENLHKVNFDQINKQLIHEDIALTFPKFKIESKFDLREMLPKLGLHEMWKNGANLTGITERNGKVSKMVQKAFVEVTEKSTEASAATGASTLPVSGKKSLEYRADHPFLFFLVNKKNCVLFVGRVLKP